MQKDLKSDRSSVAIVKKISIFPMTGKNSSYTFPIAFNRIRKERYRSTISLTREKTPPEEVQLSLPIKVYFSSMLRAQKINHNKYGRKAKREETQPEFAPSQNATKETLH